MTGPLRLYHVQSWIGSHLNLPPSLIHFLCKSSFFVGLSCWPQESRLVQQLEAILRLFQPGDMSGPPSSTARVQAYPRGPTSRIRARRTSPLANTPRELTSAFLRIGRGSTSRIRARADGKRSPPPPPAPPPPHLRHEPPGQQRRRLLSATDHASPRRCRWGLHGPLGEATRSHR